MRHLRFYLRLLTWFSMRQMRTHPWRILAVLFGIGLGAAVFTSVRLAVDASLDSFSNTMDLISGRADWVVTKPGGRVPEALVGQLRMHFVVEAASPLLTSYVQLSEGRSEPFLLIGLDPILDWPLRTWKVANSSQKVEGLWQDLVRIPNTILLSERLGSKLEMKPGDSMTLEHVHQITPFQVLGILEPQGLALVEGGHAALIDIATMQEFTGSQGWVDRIDLLLKSHVTKKDMDQIRDLLPPGIVLEAPTETKETGNMMIHAYQLNLSVLSFASLFVGMFLVYSMVALNAASRRHEVAILRSLGASSRLVFLLFLTEGILLGVVGWFLAIPMGSFLVKYLLSRVSSTISDLFVQVHVEGLRLDTWEILLSFGITLLISLLAAYGPARAVTHIMPREAMLMRDTVAQKRASPSHPTLLALLFIALTWPVSQLPSPHGFPIAGYVAVFVLFVGFSFLSPWILQLMGSYLPPLLRRLAGEPAYLGGRYVRDAGKRTAISVGALVTAMALFVALVITVHSFRHTVELWVSQTLSGDLFLRPKMAGLNQYRDSLPQDVVRALQKLPTEVELLPYRRIHLRYGRIPYQLEAIDFDDFLRYGDFITLEGNMEEIAQELAAGKGVLVSEVFANQTGLAAGQRYRAQLGQANLDTPILGICRDYRTRGGVVYTDLRRFQQLTGDLQWSGVRFFFTDRHQDLEDKAARLRAEILRLCAQDHPLEMASGGELRREILRIFDETFAITSVLLLIALLVAGLGVTTTLTVLVLERIRQLNTLVAVGAGNGQIRTMIFWEAVLMVIAGQGSGLTCGFLLSYLLIYVITQQSFGWTFLYVVDWASLLVSLPLILATSLVAALPATRLVLHSSPALVLKEQ